MAGAGSGTGYSMDITPIDTVPMDTHPLVDYSYWHLVEMVYIYIYIHLYYYYIRYPPSPCGPPYLIRYSPENITGYYGIFLGVIR